MSFERGDLFRGCGVNPDAPDEAPGDARSAAIDALGPASESLFQTAEQRWEVVLARDRTADGRFVYAELGRAQVLTSVTNASLVCPVLLEINKTIQITN